MRAIENAICHGLKRADSTYWKSVYNKIFESNHTSENVKLRIGLACHLDKEILRHYLNLNWNSTTSQVPFSKVVTAMLEENDAGVDSVLDFMYEMKSYFHQ